jgi:CRP-like cAMP-binding protein
LDLRRVNRGVELLAMRPCPAKSNIPNRLLQALSEQEYTRLSLYMEVIHLPRGRVLFEAGDRAHFVYFPLNGVVSLLSSTQIGEMVEVGMIGNEGTTWVPVTNHAQALPYKVLIQISADALRCEAEAVRDEFLRGGKLHSLLTCHTHWLFAQISQSAVCNRFHATESRFCRWLLCMHDLVESDTLPLTHEIISNMLGAERAHTSRTAKALQNNRLITYTPGSITILDRQGLEATSCECYQVVKQQATSCLAA